MVRNWLKRLVVLAVIFVSTSYASAAQLAYEGFNYTGSLVGQAGGTGFSAAAWASVSGYSNPALATGSMSYTNGGNTLVTTGNKVQPALQSRATRNFASAITTASQTQWVSFRISQTDTGALPNYHAGFALYSGVNGTGSSIFLGKPYNATNWGIDLAGTVAQKSGSVTTADRNALLVYKLVFTTSQVTVSMWVNPAFSEGSLGTAHATLTGSWSTTIASMFISTGNNSSNYQFDEFRFGTTFGDAVPPTVIAYEGFGYTGNLVGKNGGTGYGSNAWAAFSGYADPVLTTSSMSYTSGSNSLQTSGNKVQPAVQSRATRNFAGALPTANQTMWVSFRINQTDTGGLPAHHAGFALYSGTNATGSSLFLGKPWNSTNWGMDLNGTVSQASGSVTSGNRNALLVFKLVFTTTNVTASMWVNPPLVEASLGTPALSSSAAWSLTIASMFISAGNTSVNYQFDEFRLGNSFDGVAPIQSGGTLTPTDGAGLTAALNSCNLGDTIILQAGTVYTAPSGGFVLPNKTSGSGYITIQSSNLGSLPATGVRVNLSHASNMPKIKPPAYNSSAIKTATSAHHFKFIGLEIIGTQSGTLESNADLIALGHNVNDGTQDQLSEVPNNIIFDRCIIRAESDTHRIKRGIGLNSASTDITNSYLTNIKHTGADSQAIGGFNGPGPFNIINNFLEGGGENVMFGGDDPRIPNLVPSDIVIQRNLFTKRLSWNRNMPATWDGINWVCKNSFELKNARNVTLDNNIFENSWQPSQDGYLIGFSPRNQGGNAPWCIVENVTVRNNIWRNAACGISLLGDDNNFPSGRMNHITIENNLIYGIGGSQWGAAITGRLHAISRGCDTVTINHNTAFHTGTGLFTDGPVDHTGFVFTNNILAHNDYCASGPTGQGNICLNDWYPGCVFQKNVLMNNMGLNLTSLLSQYTMGWSPANLAFPTSWGPVLVNQANPGSNFAGYKVVTGSVYDNGGTDGTDLGCNIDAVNAATAGCVSGVWP